MRRIGYNVVGGVANREEDDDGRESDAAVSVSSEDEVFFEPAPEDKFNDEVRHPAPSSMRDVAPYDGPENPLFARLVHKSPKLWRSSLVTHVQPLLAQMHMPAQHRSHIALCIEDVRRNHHVVWWRAAYSYLKRAGGWEDIGAFVTGIDEQAQSADAKMWAAALEWPEEGAVYFAEKRAQVMERGWCVLGGFMADHKLPEQVVVSPRSYIPEACAAASCSGGGGGSSAEGHVVVQPSATLALRRHYSRAEALGRLETHVTALFPNLQQRVEQPHPADWSWIINRGAVEDSEEGGKGVGRYMSKHRLVTETLEEGDAWGARARALQDARIGQAVSCLRLGGSSGSSSSTSTTAVAAGSRPSVPSMFVPNTGGRWLVTVKGCGRQTLHSDFAVQPEVALNDKGNPGFFTVTTGAQDVAIWLCPRSHRDVGREMQEERTALRGVLPERKAEKVRVAPYSILVARGDMQHCGAAYEDNGSQADAIVRYHMYFVPTGEVLPDGVHRRLNYKPRFPAEAEEEEEATAEVEEEEDCMEVDNGESDAEHSD